MPLLSALIFSFILSISYFPIFCDEEVSFFEEKGVHEENDDSLFRKGKKSHKERKKEFEWNLAVVSVFQDEAEWLKEWIEYHKIVGVEHFYLYNNLSSDNFSVVLRPYLDSGEVELFDWPYLYPPGKEGLWIKVQTDAIMDAINRSKDQTKWLAIIDIDEFLVPVKYNTITELLNVYDRIIPKLSQLSINWVLFGTSNVVKIPDDRLMIEVLTKNAGKVADPLFKSIVKPRDVVECGNTHYCNLIKNKKEERVPYHYAQINHYWTRDEFYLNEVKIPRREKIGYPQDVVLSWATSYNLDNEETANPIKRFIGRLRQNLGKE